MFQMVNHGLVGAAAGPIVGALAARAGGNQPSLARWVMASARPCAADCSDRGSGPRGDAVRRANFRPSCDTVRHPETQVAYGIRGRLGVVARVVYIDTVFPRAMNNRVGPSVGVSRVKSRDRSGLARSRVNPGRSGCTGFVKDHGRESYDGLFEAAGRRPGRSGRSPRAGRVTT